MILTGTEGRPKTIPDRPVLRSQWGGAAGHHRTPSIRSCGRTRRRRGAPTPCRRSAVPPAAGSWQPHLARRAAETFFSTFSFLPSLHGAFPTPARPRTFLRSAQPRPTSPTHPTEHHNEPPRSTTPTTPSSTATRHIGPPWTAPL